jgi:TIGR03009 family protein
MQPVQQQQPVLAPRYNPPPGGTSIYQNQPQVPTPAGQPPIRLAQGGQTLYTPPAGQQPPPGMTHMGRAEPASRIIPFFLNPEEQQELDEFLARWERYSTSIKRYDVNFTVHEYDMTIPGAETNKPTRICYGYFKYIANPTRFVYVIEGEERDGKRIKRDDKNPHIYAEKTIIEEKRVFKFDYNSKTVYQINVPPELIGKGIADSPLPLIFGARADDLKRRFSMKVVNRPDGMIVLYARPLLPEDQQEFKELQILLEKDLRAKALMQYDINDKSRKAFELKEPKIDDRLGYIIEDMAKFFKPDKPIGWKLEVSDWTIESPAQPVPTMGVPRPQMGNPMPSYPNPNPNDMQLYQR